MDELLSQFDFNFTDNFSISSYVINIIIAAILLYILSIVYRRYGNSISTRPCIYIESDRDSNMGEKSDLPTITWALSTASTKLNYKYSLMILKNHKGIVLI